MKDELSKKLVEVIGAIQNGVGKASDFAVEQLPDIAQQYIAYGRVIETFWTAVALLGIVVSGLVIRYGRKRLDDIDVYMPCFIAGGVGAAVSLVCSNMSAFAMVWFAPKIYLIKGLGGLIK